MVKVFRAVLLAILLNIAVAQADQKQIVYLVSSRPLGSFYSHPLSAQLATQTHNDVYAMYITLGYGDGGTSSEQLMHSVSEDIQRVDPSIVIIDEVDAAGYLQTLLPEKYRTKSYFISRSTTAGLPRSSLFRVQNLGLRITDLMTEMNLFPETYYILYDSSGLTARDSYNLRKTLQGITGSVKAIEVTSAQQLDDILLELNKNQRGVIINNMMTLIDDEFGSYVGAAEIKEIIRRRNKKHLTVGFSFLPDTKNECVIFQTDYYPIVREFFHKGQNPDDMWPLPFKLYVDKGAMRSLGYKNNYIAAHETIDVIVE
tara:strand:- start:71173 stop:72114 length:942 start_codon:yes stop_codon:yes gene_type:complete